MDLEALAWAAGLFDGEGSTYVLRAAGRPGYLRIGMQIRQHGDGAVPEVLHRFQAAMLGMGSITGPYGDGTYGWRDRGFEQTRACVALLWRWLGTVKRAQAAAAMRALQAQLDSGTFASRRGGVRAGRLAVPVRTGSTTDEAKLVRAWAAGFLDGEGCFGLARSKPRVGGQPWHRLRVSADQHGDVGTPAAVLIRLHKVIGVGRIERHGQPDDFKWVAEGLPAVERVLAIVGPWLGSVKREQARAAIVTFASQERLKGDRTRCKRAHVYDRRTTTSTGRTRVHCNACARIRDRRKRAARGIAPRPLKDIRRRYTD